MDAVQTAGSVDVNLRDETKITENAIRTEEASEKIGGSGFDSRGRRKSKYLSSPYTNIGSKQKDLPAEAKDLRTPCLSQRAEAPSAATRPLNGSSSYAKLGSKRFRRNWHRKFISCCTMPRSSEFINAPLHELLSGLYSAAVDCMFPVENKGFDLVEWFFCRYRVSAFHDEAELASSLVNEKGGKIGKTVGTDLPDIKSKKKRKNNKMENSVKRKTKSLSGLSDMNTNNSCGDSLMPAKRHRKKRKVEEVTSLHQLQNVGINLNECGSIYSSVPEAPQNLSCLASEGMAPDKKREKIEASQLHQSAEIAAVYTDTKGNKCNSLVIDLQFTSPRIPVGIPGKSNGENKEEFVLIASNPKSFVSQGPVGNITNHKLLVSTASEVGSVSVNKTNLKSRMEKAAEEPLNTKLAVGTITNHRLLVSTASEIGSVSVNKIGLKSRMDTAAEEPLNTKLVGNITNNRSLVSTASEFGSVLVNKTGLKAPQEPLNTKLAVGNITNNRLLVSTTSEIGSVSVNQTGLKSRMEKGAEELLNTKLAVGNIANHSLLVTTASEVGSVSVNKAGLINRMERAAEEPLNFKPAVEIPDLNGTNSEYNSVSTEFHTINFLSPGPKSEQSRTLSACSRPTKTTTDHKVEGNGESLGTCLLLQFAPGVCTLSKEELMTAFCQFGPLKASETQLFKETGSAQVVFVRSADAAEAFHFLEQNKLFPIGGSAVVDYKLQHLPVACPPLGHLVTPTQPTGSMPMPGGGNPPLQFIKQNLQMMTSILENSGNNLSPQMRAKLDAEIKSLMRKVNSRTNV